MGDRFSCLLARRRRRRVLRSTAAADGSPQDRAQAEIARGRGAAGPRDAGRRRRRGRAPTSRRRATSCATRTSPSRAPASRRRSAWPSSRSPTRAARSAARARASRATRPSSSSRATSRSSGRAARPSSRRASAQPLFDGDFVKAGKTGSAEIMFYDGTLYTIRPGSLFECRRPVSSEVAGKPDQDRLGRGQRLHVRTRTRRSPPTRRPPRSTATRACPSTSSPGDKTEVTSFRGRTTVSTGKETRRPGRPREGLGRGRRRAPFSPKVALPDSPQPALPADNRIYDLKTGDQVELKWTKVAGGRPLPPPDLALAPLRAGLDRGRPGRPRADERARQGLARRGRTSGASRRSTPTA